MSGVSLEKRIDLIKESEECSAERFRERSKTADEIYLLRGELGKEILALIPECGYTADACRELWQRKSTTGELFRILHLLGQSMFVLYCEQIVSSMRAHAMYRLKPWANLLMDSHIEGNGLVVKEAAAQVSGYLTAAHGDLELKTEMERSLAVLWQQAVKTQEGQVIFGDATAPQMNEAADILYQQARDLIARARFYRRIADKMMEGQFHTVRQLGTDIFECLAEETK